MFSVKDYEVESEQTRKQDEQNKQIVEAQGVFATLVHARQSVNPLGERTAGSTIERDGPSGAAIRLRHRVPLTEELHEVAYGWAPTTPWPPETNVGTPGIAEAQAVDKAASERGGVDDLDASLVSAHSRLNFLSQPAVIRM
jgi:hypothetical protein